jgi:hypothetical protein
VSGGEKLQIKINKKKYFYFESIFLGVGGGAYDKQGI